MQQFQEENPMFYGVPPGRDKELQQALATIADIYKGNFYCNDMLICLWRNLSFQHDKKFIKCFYDAVTNEQEQSLIWRLHTLSWAAKNALSVEGDFVECGVFKGFCSSVILKYLDFQDLPRQAYLYDTFEGLPEKTSTESERRAWDYTQYDAEAIYKGVRERFSVYKNVNIVRGIVPDSFDVAVPEKIAFLHIDMNSAQAEMLALEHLFDKVTPGGVIVFDDFGWTCNVNQMTAELAFMNARGQHILELPTGQGVVIKQA
jgi:O-methyltransferase